MKNKFHITAAVFITSLMMILALSFTTASAGHRMHISDNEKMNLMHEENRSLNSLELKRKAIEHAAMSDMMKKAGQKNSYVWGSITTGLTRDELIALDREENRSLGFYETGPRSDLKTVGNSETRGYGYHPASALGSVRASLDDASKHRLTQEEMK